MMLHNQPIALYLFIHKAKPCGCDDLCAAFYPGKSVLSAAYGHISEKTDVCLVQLNQAMGVLKDAVKIFFD